MHNPILMPARQVLRITRDSGKAFFFYFLNHFYCYSIPVIPIFPPLPSSTHSTPTPTVNSHSEISQLAKDKYHLISPIRKI